MDAKAQNYATLCKAIDRRDKKTARRLIMGGTHLNLPSKNSNDSPLHISIRKFANPEIIELLLKHGANTNLKNRRGETPLDVAVKVRNKTAFKLLMKYGNYKLAEINKVLKPDTSTINRDFVKSIMEYEPRWIPTKLLVKKSKKATSSIYDYFINGYKIHPSSKVSNFDLAYRLAESGNLQTLEQIFKSDFNVNEYNPESGFTLLHLACIKQNRKLVSLLIQHKANLNLEVCHPKKVSNQGRPSEETTVMAGRTALYITVENSNLEITKLLVNSGAHVTSEPDLIKIAIEKKNKAMIQLLLSSGIPINDANFEGITPLHYSIVSYSSFYKSGISEWEIEMNFSNNDDDKYPIVEFLIKHGANVNAQTNERKLTPLHVAVEKNYPNIVKLLLKNNANPNLVDSDNYMPFYVSIFKKRKIINDIFLQSGIDLNVKNEFDSTPLHISCVTSDIKVVEELLKKKVLINCVDKYGRTPLHNACETGNFEIINRLLDYKADINIKDTFEQTPFHILAKLRTMNSYDTGDDLIEICERFISMGVDINLGDVEKKTPLFIACLYGCREIIEVLLKHKANIHRRDVFDRPPVYVAAGKAARNTGILKLLVDNNANADYIDMNKNTIIHTAAAANNPDFDEIMDKVYVDINAINSEGDTALHIASKNGFLKIIYSLINNGADINITNAENKTAVQVAIDKIRTLQQEVAKYRERLGFMDDRDDFLDDSRSLSFEFGINDYENIIEFFQLLSIQLHKANFYVDPKIFEIIFLYTKKDMTQFEDTCTQELQIMKESRISGTNWYNLLTCNIHDIAKFSENIDVQAVIMYNDKPKFPIYQNILQTRFKQGIARYKQMKFIQLYHYSSLSIFKSLPYSCVYQIFHNLDIKDILTFKNAVTGRYNT